ncbi:hypothetical protein Tco_0161104, partial [Tanacetum coccineum]
IDSTTKVDSEPPNGSNDDITNPYECNLTQVQEFKEFKSDEHSSNDVWTKQFKPRSSSKDVWTKQFRPQSEGDYQNQKGTRNAANYHIYHALMEALIADEDAMDKKVADKVKNHKRKHDSDDDDEDDDDDEGPSA